MAEKKVTKKKAKAEVMKYARKVSADDVASTVRKAGVFKKLFSCVVALSAYKEDVMLVFSMLNDYVSGKYDKVPWRIIAVLVGALAYVLTPVDLIPDFIPAIGWSDDCLALAAALSFARMDLEDYKAWKADRHRG